MVIDVPVEGALVEVGRLGAFGLQTIRDLFKMYEGMVFDKFVVLVVSRKERPTALFSAVFKFHIAIDAEGTKGIRGMDQISP